MKISRQLGFTLIELSLVFVIIALIAAGVLVGKDLMHNAEIRKFITQRERFETGVNAFRNKFNCLPGDCSKAVELGVGDEFDDYPSYANDGNSNGKLDGNEAVNFWYHLAKASLIPWQLPTSVDASVRGGSPCVPFTATNHSPGYYGDQAGWWVRYMSSNESVTAYDFMTSRHYWWITPNAGIDEGAAALLPMDAFAIDSKIDDGLPLSGIVTAVGDFLDDPASIHDPTMGEDADGIDHCVDNLNDPIYNVDNFNQNENNLCSLMIRAGF